MKRFILLFVIALLVTGCGMSKDNKTTESKKSTSEESQYIKVKTIEEKGKNDYCVIVFNKGGKKIFEETEHSEPIIKRINESIYSIIVPAGTGVSLVRYFDIGNDSVSKEFISPFDFYKNRTVYYDGKSIIVENVFDKLKCYKNMEIKTSDTITPILDVKFVENGKIRIKYSKGKNYEEVTEVFDIKKDFRNILSN